MIHRYRVPGHRDRWYFGDVGDSEVVLDALQDEWRESVGLCFVPPAVAYLRRLGYARVHLHQILLNLDRTGLIELRPESGLNRLSQEALDDCPPGPQGTKLSWARML